AGGAGRASWRSGRRARGAGGAGRGGGRGAGGGGGRGGAWAGGVASTVMDHQNGEPPGQNAIAGGSRVVARGCAVTTGRDIGSRAPGEGESHETVTERSDRGRRRRRCPRRVGGSALVPRGRLPRGPALSHTGRPRERAHPSGDRSPDAPTRHGLLRPALRRVRRARRCGGRRDGRAANASASPVWRAVRPGGAGSRVLCGLV